MKAYTNIEQSKRLAEILPLESADMYWAMETIPYLCLPLIDGTTDWDYAQENNLIPAWSLAALLEVLPKGTNVSTPKPLNELSYCCWNHQEEFFANNPVDACVEMINKLHDQKLL